MDSDAAPQMVERNLVLIRHSLSKPDPSNPPHLWGLTDGGRVLCRPLADKLAVYQPDVIVTSHEPKAQETGWIVAQALAVPCYTAENLHEHARESGKLLSRDAFVNTISDLCANPGQLVFGTETAQEALDRFSGGVESVMMEDGHQNIAIVSHGTVMSLFYEAITGDDAFRFWLQLGLPGFYVVSWPNRVLKSEVLKIGKGSPTKRF